MTKIVCASDEASQLLTEVLNSTFQKMIKCPDKTLVYLKALKMLLDLDFIGMTDEMKDVIVEYLTLKCILAEKQEKEEE